MKSKLKKQEPSSKGDVIYTKLYPVRSEKENIIFKINIEEENRLKEIIDKYRKREHRNYTENFILKDSIKRLDIIKESIKRCNLYKNQIEINNKLIEETKYKVHLLYIKLGTERKSNLNKDEALELCRNITYLQNDIKNLEMAIGLAYKDYVNATE